MTKDIKDYLHLYVGCDVEYCKETYFLGAIHVFPQKDTDEYMVNIWASGLCDTVPYTEIKPILRPLSDMTGDEQVEYIKLTKLVTDGVHTVQIRIDTPESFLWKIYHRFDLFGLIESGLAIDKTKL